MKEVLLVGAGPMAISYFKVLKSLKCKVVVVGRGESSACEFLTQTDHEVRLGGLKNYIQHCDKLPKFAIIATPVDTLAENSKLILEAGVKNVLVEKPAGIDPQEVTSVHNYSLLNKANVFVAYNRRFYSSVISAKDRILADGGATSLRIEFSEWSERIRDSHFSTKVKSHWLYANSTHVLDMGFYIAGFPSELHCEVSGSLDWHNAGAQFVGHGRLPNGALFSYHADWMAAPRWMIEVMTTNGTYMFNPLEKLKFRSTKSFEVAEIDINDEVDNKFKPGLYEQTRHFLNGQAESLLSIADHVDHMNKVYSKILQSSNGVGNA